MVGIACVFASSRPSYFRMNASAPSATPARRFALYLATATSRTRSKSRMARHCSACAATWCSATFLLELAKRIVPRYSRAFASAVIRRRSAVCCLAAACVVAIVAR